MLLLPGQQAPPVMMRLVLVDTHKHEGRGVEAHMCTVQPPA